MILATPFQGAMGKRLMKSQVEILARRDARVKFTNEILQGIKLLKFFAWETPLSKQVPPTCVLLVVYWATMRTRSSQPLSTRT